MTVAVVGAEHDAVRAVHHFHHAARGVQADAAHILIDQSLVVLAAAPALQHVQPAQRGLAPAVATVGGHRVVDITQRDDARHLRDARSLELARIAGAIERFVVPVGHVDRAVAEIAVRHQDIAALGGVGLHELELLLRQRAFLVENLQRRERLAHIVQHRGDADGVEILLAMAEVAREIDRQQPDVDAMLRGIGVAVADPGQPHHRVGTVDHVLHRRGNRAPDLLHVDHAPEANVVHDAARQRARIVLQAGRALVGLDRRGVRDNGPQATRRGPGQRVRGRRHPLVLVVLDHHFPAVLRDLRDLLHVLEPETLEHERRVGPRAVELHHAHADFQRLHGNTRLPGGGAEISRSRSEHL